MEMFLLDEKIPFFKSRVKYGASRAEKRLFVEAVDKSLRFCRGKAVIRFLDLPTSQSLLCKPALGEADVMLDS
jgi:hypothetical protein